jgi:hypothetical protein
MHLGLVDYLLSGGQGFLDIGSLFHFKYFKEQ